MASALFLPPSAVPMRLGKAATTFTLGHTIKLRARFVAELRCIWDQDLPDEDWVVRYLQRGGSDRTLFPPN